MRETFRLDHGDRGCAIWNFGCARYAVAEDGAVVMKAADGVAATGFEVEVVSSGRDAAQRIAAVADAVVVVVGTRCRDLQHGAAACAPAPERETSRWAGTPWSRQAVWLNPGAGQSVGKLTATRAIATRHSGCFP